MGVGRTQQPVAVGKDLAQQRLAHREQVDQIDRPARGHGQVTDQGHLLRGAEWMCSLHGDVQVAVVVGGTTRR